MGQSTTTPPVKVKNAVCPVHGTPLYYSEALWLHCRVCHLRRKARLAGRRPAPIPFTVAPSAVRGVKG
jgi:hypothetical protein